MIRESLVDTVMFTGADFSIQHDGVCPMNPELARRVAQLALEPCEISNRRNYSIPERPAQPAIWL